MNIQADVAKLSLLSGVMKYKPFLYGYEPKALGFLNFEEIYFLKHFYLLDLVSMIQIKDVAEKWGLSRTTIYRYLEKQ
ncbi:helix-turn-helix domain-containing protein [Peribacillus butanolivorans]|uniref:helix-turn-helix domain-containing protein n=1 Tax=Peribacillus butanolivorans TaxID=421767 RepID=UPI00380E7708